MKRLRSIDLVIARWLATEGSQAASQEYAQFNARRNEFRALTQATRKRLEAIYKNMPIFGLAKTTEHVPARGRLETARRRLRRGENEPAVPSPE